MCIVVGVTRGGTGLRIRVEMGFLGNIVHSDGTY